MTSSSTTAAPGDNIFTSGPTGPPVANIPINQTRHPEPKKGIKQNGPIETNKFYSNLYLGTQNNSAFTIPYSLTWSQGQGSTKSWGMSVDHVDKSKLAFGSFNETTGARSFYANPIGLQYLVLSASELSEATVLTTDSLTAFSVNANLSVNNGSAPLITFPLLQGMAFATAVYKGATPLLQSGIGFQALSEPTSVGSVTKYKIALLDGSQWLVYVKSDSAEFDAASLTLNGSSITAPGKLSGIIQVAKNPNGDDGAKIYDASAGAYPTGMRMTGSTAGSTGSYTFAWTKTGVQSSPLLTFALAHHIASFDDRTRGKITTLYLRSQTKGRATAVVGDSWKMVEKLPVGMGFNPWRPNASSAAMLSDGAKSLINSAASTELNGDITKETDLDSMYFSGKGLAKWAQMVYVVSKLTGNNDLAASGLQKLKNAFARFVNNRQQNPLAYDNTWKGVVSTAGLSGDSGADFGNSFYNDHHFHYGYHVYGASVIASLDPSWLTTGTNKAYVDTLVRDFASPVKDEYFPFSRSFDWYHGHSWAKGLFASGDGKDQESSSEDAFASYALKMWGKVTGDAKQEARGNLMLAVQANSFQKYFLMTSDNKVQLAEFIGNKADGIMFENKVDHTTYFGADFYLVEGIHMIPLNPCSTLIRTKKFVSEEWKVYFDNGRVDQVPGGWRGLLMANLAIINPRQSFQFFANENFNYSLLDGGMSRTWSLAFAGLLGGDSAATARDLDGVMARVGGFFKGVRNKARAAGPAVLSMCNKAQKVDSKH